MEKGKLSFRLAISQQIACEEHHVNACGFMVFNYISPTCACHVLLFFSNLHSQSKSSRKSEMV